MKGNEGIKNKCQLTKDYHLFGGESIVLVRGNPAMTNVRERRYLVKCFLITKP
jgi:hypothetical protein